MNYGLGYRHDLEDKSWLRANELRFSGSALSQVSIPQELDPRKYRSVRDQAQLGSCSGASRTAVEEGLNQYASGTHDKILLSMMYAYLTNQRCCDCFGSDQGATIAGSVQAAGKYGICRESLFPYTGRYTTSIPEAASAEGVKHLIRSHSTISSYDEAVQYLGSAGVIQIGIPVGDQFQGCQGPLTARMLEADTRNPEGGHALAVIGYVLPATIGVATDGSGAWLIGQNSWGTQWGAGGFFYIEPEGWDFLCRQAQGGGNVELDGMSHLDSFDNPDAAIEWSVMHL